MEGVPSNPVTKGDGSPALGMIHSQPKIRKISSPGWTQAQQSASFLPTSPFQARLC